MKALEEILSEILVKYDLSVPQGRQAAYEECIEFAETRLKDDLRCNAFLRMAASMLEQDMVQFDVIREMLRLPPDALLDLAYDDSHGFMLTGNASGLEYLAELLQLLAEAPEGEHVHFYNDERPLTSISYSAVFYKENDEWFERAEKEASEMSSKGSIMKRTIQPGEIFAVQVVGNLPASAPLSRDRLYRVEKVTTEVLDLDDDVGEEKFWWKAFDGAPDRLVCLEVTDDYGEHRELVLHLDDPDVIYFKRADIEELFY